MRRLRSPLVAIIVVLAAELTLLGGEKLGREPLISLNIVAHDALHRFGSAEVGISFGESSWPETLQVVLLRQRAGGPPVEFDVTDQFSASENGAVGSLSGLPEGRYTVQARVFGNVRGRGDLLIEQDATVELTVFPPPSLDRA